MTYAETVKKIAGQTNLKKGVVDDVLKEFIETVKHEVMFQGREIVVPKFGRFKQKIIKPGVVPGTYGTIKYPGRTGLRFKSFV